MIRKNTNGDYPQIDRTAYIDSTATLIGKIKIGKNVFVGPGAVLRADEKSSAIIIHDNCNIQDRVIIHALGNSSVVVAENTSLSHGCIIHGPCKIGRGCFIGFGSVVFNAKIKDGVVIKHLSCIEEVNISYKRTVDSGIVLNNKKDAGMLNFVDADLKKFAQKVVRVNLGLVKGYKNKRLYVAFKAKKIKRLTLKI